MFSFTQLLIFRKVHLLQVICLHAYYTFVHILGYNTMKCQISTSRKISLSQKAFQKYEILFNIYYFSKNLHCKRKVALLKNYKTQLGTSGDFYRLLWICSSHILRKQLIFKNFIQLLLMDLFIYNSNLEKQLRKASHHPFCKLIYSQCSQKLTLVRTSFLQGM